MYYRETVTNDTITTFSLKLITINFTHLRVLCHNI